MVAAHIKKRWEEWWQYNYRCCAVATVPSVRYFLCVPLIRASLLCPPFHPPHTLACIPPELSPLPTKLPISIYRHTLLCEYSWFVYFFAGERQQALCHLPRALYFLCFCNSGDFLFCFGGSFVCDSILLCSGRLFQRKTNLCVITVQIHFESTTKDKPWKGNCFVNRFICSLMYFLLIVAVLILNVYPTTLAVIYCDRLSCVWWLFLYT